MSDNTPSEPDIRPAKPGFFARFSLVWLVPVAALAVALGVAWQSYADRGVLVEIAFADAAGISVGDTELRYRNVSVGQVTQLRFSDDLSQVIVGVRVDQEIAPYLDEGAEFWVVRPEVSVRGIRGLDTVLSGVFIEGAWDSEPGPTLERFDGLEERPLARPTRDGTYVRLRAPDGNSLAQGAPILHKGIRVGHIEAPRLTDAADAVVVNGFIEAPYDKTLTSATRFWDTSGFSLSFGTGGVTLDVSSLAALVQGGVSFDTLVSGGGDIEPETEFRIYADRTSARDSILDGPLNERLTVAAVFTGSVGGLTQGSAVRFRGVEVGEVTGISMVAQDTGQRTEVSLRATMALRADRLGLGSEATTEETLELLSEYVDQGMRARLATANILSGELVVEMVELTDAEPASFETAQGEVPVLPTAEASLSDFNATAEGVFERINALPVEELLASAQNVLDGVGRVVNSEETQAMIPELTATLAESRRVLEELREAGATESFNEALTSVEGAAQGIETAAARLPELAARINELAGRADSVLAAYGDNSRLISGALAALRDVSEAADAMRSLARTLQRNPNSLLMGR